MSNNELKENDIRNRTCYYLNDLTKIEYFEFDSILFEEKSNKDILV